MNEFLDDFSTRNIFEDEELSNIIEQARSVVSGVSPYGLKYNDVMRARITKGMSEVNDAITASIEEVPRRRIKLAVNE